MKALSMMFATILAIAGLATAQSGPDRIKVSLPALTVSGVVLPAGEAYISRLSNSADSQILLIRSEAGPQVTVVVNRLNGDGSGQPGVTLAHHGAGLVLDQVWLSASTGFQILN